MSFSKGEIIKKFRSSDSDTGSSAVQIAIFTRSIENLTRHLQEFRNDFSSRRGLMKIISKRRRLLDYLRARDVSRYRTVIKLLNIKK